MSLYQEDFVICPHCAGASGHMVSHLYHGIPLPYSFGPWKCERCKGQFSGRVIAPGEIEIRAVPYGMNYWRQLLDEAGATPEPKR